MPSFAKNTAEKINRSERTIQDEVQVASRIPEKVQTLIKDLPVLEIHYFRRLLGHQFLVTVGRFVCSYRVVKKTQFGSD